MHRGREAMFGLQRILGKCYAGRTKMGLRADEMRQIFDIVEWMHEATSEQALHRVARRGLEQLVPADSYDLVLCGAGSEGGEIFHAGPNTYTPDEIRFMLDHALEHPIAEAFGKGASGAISVSQCVTQRTWRNSALYRDGGYRRLGFHHEMAVEVPGVRSQSLAVLSVVRARADFTDRDREVLNLIRPHLGRAWVSARRRSGGISPALLRELFPILTPREAEILYWIVEGKQNAEIAAILERRLTTIQEHVENLVAKLRAENRHQMTVHVLKTCASAAWAGGER